jgi:thioredoxin 2
MREFLHIGCPHCQPINRAPGEDLEARPLLKSRIRPAKINTEAEPALAAQYAVRSLPTLILFEGGRGARQTGLVGEQDIARWVAAQVGR